MQFPSGRNRSPDHFSSFRAFGHEELLMTNLGALRHDVDTGGEPGCAETDEEDLLGQATTVTGWQEGMLATAL
jgi:hypothetical protein